jgi:predicted unusual protein kinase regulating ubiquinone biosynthesis (AarF/ABC1/UbiB family)
MGVRLERAKRALFVGRVARRSGLLRVLRELGVWGSRPATREGAQEFRQALEELGTTYIKLGQLLSSRPDLLPDVYIEELEKLVDQVPPVPFDQIQRVIAEELPANVFVSIDPEPIATASIAQVHGALLESGREVIVKVRRPGIEGQIELDLALMRKTAALLERRSERAQLLQANALADELESHLRGELDFVEEANNTEVIAGVLAEYEDLVVPQVIRPFVSEKVLVLERGITDSPPNGRASSPASSSSRTSTKSRFTASTTRTRTAGTCCSATTAGLLSSTSDCSAASTTTRGAACRCCCSRWRRIAPTTSPI